MESVRNDNVLKDQALRFVFRSTYIIMYLRAIMNSWTFRKYNIRFLFI